MRKKHFALFALINMTFLPLASASSDYAVDKELVLNAKGSATAYLCDIPPTAQGSRQALCFDIPLYNMKTGGYIGTMTEAVADAIPDTGGGMQVTVTSTFRFSEWPSQPSLTTRVLGNAQPFLGGSESMTHLTGYYPSPGTNNIIAGSKRFRHASGSARESGAANLSYFQGQPGDQITFDLIWVIKLD